MKSIGLELVRSWRHSGFLSPRVYHGVFCCYSTSNATSSSSSSSKNGVSSLYKRISAAGDPRIPMAPILDQWLLEGHEIHPEDLQFLVTRLCNFNRFAHALQVSEWMKEKHPSSLSLKDTATQLQLICKVHGLEAAEKYFNELPQTSKTREVLYALLNCYATGNSVSKAERLMQKMKKLGFAKSIFPYNIMLKLYITLEMHDKVKEVMEEFEKIGFGWSTFTYRILINAYSISGKVDEMERVLMKMEADPGQFIKHTDYISAANGYLKAGVIDKSLIMLKRAERLANDKVKKHVYHCLLTLYAQAKAKEEVYRIWNLYKRSWNVYNKSHLCMVSALVILEDLEGAEKIVDEWLESLSGHQELDSRVFNLLIRAYGKKAEFERAEALINRVAERSGQQPKRSTWDILAAGYLIHDQMEDAVKTTKKALLVDDGRWLINKNHLIRCLDYLKMKGNSAELEEFTTLLEKAGYTLANLLSGYSGDAEIQPNDQQEEVYDLDSDYIIVRKSD